MYTPATAASPREMTVASAAPSIPNPANPVTESSVVSRPPSRSSESNGLPSNPKMRNGSSRTFATTDTTTTYIGVRVSP